MAAFKQEEQQNPHIITLLDSLDSKLKRTGQLQAGFQLGTISLDEIKELVRISARINADFQQASTLITSNRYQKQIPIGASKVLELFNTISHKYQVQQAWWQEQLPFNPSKEEQLAIQFLVVSRLLANTNRAFETLLDVDDQTNARYHELSNKPNKTKEEKKELCQIVTSLVTASNSYDLLLKQSISEYVRFREDIDIALGTGQLPEKKALDSRISALHNELSRLTGAFNALLDQEEELGMHSENYRITPESMNLADNFGKSIASRMSFLFARIKELPAHEQFIEKARLYLTATNYRFATGAHHESFKHVSDSLTASLALYSFFLDAKVKSGEIPASKVTQEMRAILQEMRKSPQYQRLVEQFDPENERKLAAAEKSLARWQTAANVVELVFPATVHAYYTHLQNPDANWKDRLAFGAYAAFDGACLLLLKGGTKLLAADARAVGTLAVGAGRAVATRTAQGLGIAALRTTGAALRMGLFAWGYQEQFESFLLLVKSDDVPFEDKLFASLRFSRDVLVFEGMFVPASALGRFAAGTTRAGMEWAKRTVLENFYASWLMSQVGANAEAFAVSIARTASRLASQELTPEAAAAMVSIIREFGRETGVAVLETFGSRGVRTLMKEGALLVLAVTLQTVMISPSAPSLSRGSKPGTEFAALPIEFSLTYDTEAYIRLRHLYQDLLSKIPRLDGQFSLYDLLELQAFRTTSSFEDTAKFVTQTFGDYQLYLTRSKGAHLSFGKYVIQRHLYNNSPDREDLTFDQWCTISLLSYAQGEESYAAALAEILKHKLDK